MSEWKPDYSITPQRIVCAANRHRESGRIICGARHWDDIMRSQKTPEEKWSGWDQGFIDQFGKYLSRKEAWKIAEEQGQIRRKVSTDGTLYSENLY
jgi:hypothetical protein